MRQLLPIKGGKIAASVNPVAAAFIKSLAGIAEHSSEIEVKSHVTHKKIDGKIADTLIIFPPLVHQQAFPYVTKYGTTPVVLKKEIVEMVRNVSFYTKNNCSLAP